MDNKELINLATVAAQGAYAPYSGFKVGAALLTSAGTVFTGFNIENASFGATVCAERAAFFKAITEGERDFVKIAVVGGKDGVIDALCPPCGICRQVMAEFCKKDFTVVLADGKGNISEYPLCELLPLSFSLDDD